MTTADRAAVRMGEKLFIMAEPGLKSAEQKSAYSERVTALGSSEVLKSRDRPNAVVLEAETQKYLNTILNYTCPSTIEWQLTMSTQPLFCF